MRKKNIGSFNEKLNNMKIAIIHDFLIRHGGAENVLQVFSEMFPEAPIYTFIYDEEKMGGIFPKERIRTSFLQNFPGILKNKYKYLLPFFPVASETFDLRDFDVIISSSSSFAKGIVPRVNSIHICYCHNPMRFVWDYSHLYLKDQKKGNFLNGIIKLAFHNLRIWDRNAAQRVDYFIANSQVTKKRIKKYYQKDSVVIYPPVDMPDGNFDGYDQGLKERDFFLIVSQLAPYKRIDMAVSAFNKLKMPLVVIGDGPERKKLERNAKSNIKFLGWQDNETVKKYYKNCLAFIFPGEDDFGIAPVEAMSYGKPVLALRRGGATETVIEGVTGEFFEDADPAVLADGVRRLREKISTYDKKTISKHARKFCKERFVKEISDFIENATKNNVVPEIQ